MKDFQRVLAVTLITALAGCAATPEPPTPAGLTQSGSFTIRENQLLLAATGHTGEGTLIFQGWQYGFLFEDMKVGVTGPDSIELEGTVYNMETLADFEGRYTLTRIETQGGEGLTGVWGKNEKGVVAYLRAKGQDLEIDLQAAGARFTLK